MDDIRPKVGKYYVCTAYSDNTNTGKCIATHNNEFVLVTFGIFKKVKNPFLATRYHSLIIDRKTLPSNFVISASTKDGIIMGIKEKKYPLFGVQFHPESILTEEGKKILENFLKL